MSSYVALVDMTTSIDENAYFSLWLPCLGFGYHVFQITETRYGLGFGTLVTMFCKPYCDIGIFSFVMTETSYSFIRWDRK